jgi:site-specific recombinase XerD
LVAEWPLPDQEAWQRACRRHKIFQGGGTASRWSPTSRANAEKGYGLFLAFLEAYGLIAAESPSLSRFSPDHIERYILSLEGKLKASSIADRLRDLYEAVRVMWPEADHEQLRVVVRHLQAAARREERILPNIVSTTEIFEAGLERMRRVSVATYEKRDVQAVQYGDGLMMAMLACKPVRLRNLQATRLSVHLVRQEVAYVWRFEPSETKNFQPIRAELPLSLTPFIDVWITRFRPTLLGDRESDALWISCHHRPMAASTIVARYRAATQDELGVMISPHHVRHCLATGVAIGAPDQVRSLPFLLDHKGEAMGKHYNLSNLLSVSDRYVGILDKRRRRALEE